MDKDKKPKVTEKQVEDYNKVVASLNETEEFDGESRIKCIRIVNGLIEYYNCKTGEKVP